MKGKTVLLATLLALGAAAGRADTVPMGQICKELTGGTSIPLGPGVATELSKNLLNAQALADYTAFEPESLQLSINAVLKAISIYLWDGGPALITDETSEPIVWQQSRIAIDTRVGVQLDPPFIDFGETQIATISAPEPSTLAFLLVAFGYMALIIKNRRRP